MNDQSVRMARALAPIRQAPPPRDSLDAIHGELERMQPEIAHALPPHISPERFRRVVLTAIQSNPDLLEADRRSLWLACVKAAQDGLLPDGREGALVTFFDRRRGRLFVQWMPMVAGILKKVRNSGLVTSITANVVYEGERFRVVLGDDERIEHERDLSLVGKAPPIAVYAIATLRAPDGGPLTHGSGAVERVREVMTWEQVEDVRAISRSPDKGPWAQWTEEMARKTVIRRLAKRLPMSSDREEDEELRRVIERVDELYEFARDRKRPEEVELERRVAERLGDAEADAPAAAGAANDDGDEAAQPEPAPPIAYVAANGNTYLSPDVASWRADWLKRIKALVLANRQSDLQAAWERNADAIAAVATVAPLTADEVVQAIRDALGFDGQPPRAPGQDNDADPQQQASATDDNADAPQPHAAANDDDDEPDTPWRIISTSGQKDALAKDGAEWIDFWKLRLRSLENARKLSLAEKRAKLDAVLAANQPVFLALRNRGERARVDEAERLILALDSRLAARDRSGPADEQGATGDDA